LVGKSIRFSSHLMDRLRRRAIDDEIPLAILENPIETLYDAKTEYEIALGEGFFRGKRRLFMVAYEEFGHEIVVVTAHPLERGDVEKKIRSGRWTRWTQK